jgi:uncharacterized membrane-anchored protein YitT (DUF2179 family)
MSAKNLNALGLFCFSISMFLLGFKPFEKMIYNTLFEGIFMGIFIGILISRYSKKG